MQKLEREVARLGAELEKTTAVAPAESARAAAERAVAAEHAAAAEAEAAETAAALEAERRERLVVAAERDALARRLAAAEARADEARAAADAARSDLADVAAASEARAEAEHRSPRARGGGSPPREVVALTLVARETEDDVATLQRRLAETEAALQEASSRLVEAFSSVGKPGSHSGASSSQRTPGSPGPAVLLATESPMPAASPPARIEITASQSVKRAGSKVSGRLSGEFQSELNADGTPRDLEAALDGADAKARKDGSPTRSGGGGGSPTGAFKGWRDSRVLGRGASNKIVKAFHPCFDASDRAVAFATRLMRVSPTARFAGAAYWLMLHVWLVFALVSAKHASGLSGVAEATGVAAAAAP